jgi:hypothetical protein
VRPVKSFDKAKEKAYWSYFEMFSSMIERNGGQVDGKIFIKALAQHHEGWFDPKVLCKPKSIKIYKEFVHESKNASSRERIREHILRSLKFLVEFCKENDINNLYDYASDGEYMIPSLMKHLKAGSISMYFVACLDWIPERARTYPPDVMKEYIPDFKEQYEVHRIRIITSEAVEDIRTRMDQVFETVLKR